MLKEKIKLERKAAVILEVDFTAPTISGYALAWLKLTNTARECSNKIWKIENERNTSMVYVTCDPKAKDDVKKFLDGIATEYVKETEKVHYIGKVINEYDVVVGVPVYEYETDCDPTDDQWTEDMDNSITHWVNVREEFL